MERITEKMVQNNVNYLNKLTGHENAKYSEIGAYTLDYAYGGVALDQYINEHGGVSRILDRCTKKELYNGIHAIITGINIAKNL